jgi:hypothetical protein
MAKALTNKPNFFVVGAAKAGTSSIYHYLSKHPEVYLSPIKEPNFFATDVNSSRFSKTFKNNLVSTKNYFQKSPLPFLQQAFIQDKNEYESLFENANHKIITESSTGYLFSKTAAKNIYDFNPNSKILIVLRNPIDRTFSHYLMALRYGFVTKPLIEAVNADLKINERAIGQAELFIDMSLYANLIKRFFDIFPSNQIKIMFFEDLKINSLAFMNELAEFLEIAYFKELEDEVINKGAIPKNIVLNKVITDLGVKKIAKYLLSSKSKELFQKWYTKPSSEVKLTQEERLFLGKFFEEDIRILKQNNPNLKFPW